MSAVWEGFHRFRALLASDVAGDREVTQFRGTALRASPQMTQLQRARDRQASALHKVLREVVPAALALEVCYQTRRAWVAEKRVAEITPGGVARFHMPALQQAGVSATEAHLLERMQEHSS
jgi:hypothetical protein